MNQTKICTIGGLVAMLTAFLWLLPSVGGAQQKLTCNPVKKIQDALTSLQPGDTLLVKGNCNENVLIDETFNNITLDGQGKATIDGGSSTAVRVRGRGITIRGFTITGRNGVLVRDGGTVVLRSNTIKNTTGTAINVGRVSFARIINNTIQNPDVVGGVGIRVTENSAARIGFLGNADTVPAGNTIRDSSIGILVRSTSSARIVGNDISDNDGDGIRVQRGSSARISDNDIDGNDGDGIEVTENSSAVLGSDTGGTIHDKPNRTDPMNKNDDFGINCTIDGYVSGDLNIMGVTDLDGTMGDQRFVDCLDRVAP